MASLTDARLASALRAAEIPYEVDDTGDAQIVVPTGDDRTQTVYVDSRTAAIGDLELRKMYAAAYVSKEDLPRRTVDFALAQNRDMPIGAWSTFLDGGELFLIFEARLPAILSPEVLREVIQFIGQTADDSESTLSTGDQH